MCVLEQGTGIYSESDKRIIALVALQGDNVQENVRNLNILTATIIENSGRTLRNAVHPVRKRIRKTSSYGGRSDWSPTTKPHVFVRSFHWNDLFDQHGRGCSLISPSSQSNGI